jgi:IclR family pca regulon transcriptional regulator
VRGIAVPLRDRHGKVIAALSVNMPIGDETAQEALDRVLQVLQDTALLIMRVL